MEWLISGPLPLPVLWCSRLSWSCSARLLPVVSLKCSPEWFSCCQTQGSALVLFSLTCQPTSDIAPHSPWLPGPCSLPLSPLRRSLGSPSWLSGAQCPAWPYSLSALIYSLSLSDITRHFFFNFLFCIGIKPINKQCCDSFRWIAKEFSCIYTCIHSPPNSPPIHAAT